MTKSLEIPRRIQQMPKRAQPKLSGIVLSIALHVAVAGTLLIRGATTTTTVFAAMPPQDVVFVSLESHAPVASAGVPNVPVNPDPDAPTVAAAAPQPLAATPPAPKPEPTKPRETKKKSDSPKPIQIAKLNPSDKLEKKPAEPVQDSTSDVAESTTGSDQASEATPSSATRSEGAASAGTIRPRLGLPGGTGTVQGIPYEQVIVSELARHKRYPERARRRGVTGEGMLKLVLARTGSVVAATVVQSTGSDLLDSEISAMVTRAEPFPASPANYPGDQLEFIVPIRFSIQ